MEPSIIRDIREYVEMCRSKGYTPDAFAFSTIYQRVHGNVRGREIDEMITKEMAKNDDKG